MGGRGGPGDPCKKSGAKPVYTFCEGLRCPRSFQHHMFTILNRFGQPLDPAGWCGGREPPKNKAGAAAPQPGGGRGLVVEFLRGLVDPPPGYGHGVP